MNTNNMTNVLCIRVDSMGDVLMTSPAFRAIRESIPNIHLTLLTSSEGKAIAQMIPEVDAIITSNAPWESKHPDDSKQLLELVITLKQKKFDAAIIFTVFSQNPLPSVLLCYLAEIPIRIAYCHENPQALLTHWIPDPEPKTIIRHEVQRQLDLVSVLNCKTENTQLSLNVPEDAKKEARNILKDEGIDVTKPWIVIHPGAASISRRYDSDEISQAGKELVKKLGINILVTGTASEKELVADVVKKIGNNAYNIAGKLSLQTFCGLIALSPVLITNNSGPAHIAAAMGTPVVDLYALTNPQHTPWNVPHEVLFFKVKQKPYYTPTLPLSPHVKPLRNYHDIVAATITLLEEHSHKAELTSIERIYA